MPNARARRSARRRQRFFDAKDAAAVDAALPDMLEEAVSIIEDDVKMRESDEIKKHALGPAARAVSARTSMPAH